MIGNITVRYNLSAKVGIYVLEQNLVSINLIQEKVVLNKRKRKE